MILAVSFTHDIVVGCHSFKIDRSTNILLLKVTYDSHVICFLRRLFRERYVICMHTNYQQFRSPSEYNNHSRRSLNRRKNTTLILFKRGRFIPHCTKWNGNKTHDATTTHHLSEVSAGHQSHLSPPPRPSSSCEMNERRIPPDSLSIELVKPDILCTPSPVKAKVVFQLFPSK